jgi:hypothetical protein
MPLFTVTMNSNRSSSEKDCLSRAIHAASIAAGYPEDDLFQRFLSLGPSDLRVDLRTTCCLRLITAHGILAAWLRRSRMHRRAGFEARSNGSVNCSQGINNRDGRLWNSRSLTQGTMSAATY